MTQTRETRENNRRRGGAVRRMVAAAVLFVSSAALMILSARVPAFAEWHAEHIYPLLTGSIGRISGVFPFSVSEVGIYALLCVFVVTWIRLVIRTVRICRKSPGSSGPAGAVEEKPSMLIVRWIAGVLLTAGILAFLYTVCCGINYHRRSFSEEEGIVTESYSVEDLKEVCILLTEQVNVLADDVGRDENGILVLEESEQKGGVEALYSLAETYTSMEGYYPRPKELIFSEILSYQQLTGIYLPFTVEANYNGDMTSYNKPFTVCHELSHLRGFMQEQEANFIAFLACIGSEREDFRYSGYLSCWVYCTNALYRADPESWQEVRSLIDTAAELDLVANNAFWDRYEGPVSDTAERINDTYLKVNGQADGVKSYDRMVDLVVAYYTERG